MTHDTALATAETEKFQYDLNGYHTAIIEDGATVLLIADDTGEVLARYPFME